MSPFKFFELYSAISLHFKEDSKYNFYKYNGSVNVTSKSFEVRKDKYFFEKYARKFANDNDAIGFIVSNVVNGQKHITNFDYDLYLSKWVKYKESLSYLFKEEYETFLKYKKDHVVSDTPLLIELLVDEKISKEFLILLDIAFEGNIFKGLDKKDNFLWSEEIGKNCAKYKPFINNIWNADSEDLKTIVINSRI